MATIHISASQDRKVATMMLRGPITAADLRKEFGDGCGEVKKALKTMVGLTFVDNAWFPKNSSGTLYNFTSPLEEYFYLTPRGEWGAKAVGKVFALHQKSNSEIERMQRIRR